MERADVMKKVDTLLAQHRREWEKKIKSKSGQGAEDVYTSTWFAFKSLAFLVHKNKPRKTVEAGMEVSNEICQCVFLLFHTRSTTVYIYTYILFIYKHTDSVA